MKWNLKNILRILSFTHVFKNMATIYSSVYRTALSPNKQGATDIFI